MGQARRGEAVEVDGAHAPGEHDEVLVGQAGQPDAGHRRETVPLGQRHGQLVLLQRHAVDGLAQVALQSRKRQSNVTGLERWNGLCAVDLGDGHGQLRVALLERRQKRRKHIEHRRADRADRQEARLSCRRFPHCKFEPLELLRELAHRGKDGRPRWRELGTAP
ncbi:hypothetical protein D3C71_1228020 [compost metagenome]